MQILDKLCYVNNKGLGESQEDFLTLEELKAKADELNKLLMFL